MRLSEFERQAILSAITKLDSQAQVYLFGSRVHPEKRGGDIDLLVMSKILGEKDKRTIRWAICDQIGEQKIDLVIAQDTSSPFVRIALTEGVKL